MLMFQTDKGQYKAGDVVKFRLLLHDNFFRQDLFSSTKFSFRMIDEKSLDIYHEQKVRLILSRLYNQNTWSSCDLF